MLLKIFITGLVILISAIALNALIPRLGIMGWYEFLSRLAVPDGTPGPGLIDLIWLFIGYPFLLGCSALLAEKIHTFLFR